MDLTRLIKTRASNTTTSGRPLNILFATAEVVPYSKTGGLADVSASLCKALAKRGHQVSIVTPLYKFIDPVKSHFAQRLTTIAVPRKAKSQRKLDVTIWEHRLAQGVNVYFVDAPEIFHRDDLYGYDADDLEDVVERFAFFSRAIIEFCREMPVTIDVLHLNDWHTALAPVYLHYYYGNDENLASVISLHNPAFQGRFPEAAFGATGLPKSFLTDTELAQNDTFVFLKGAIKYCDAIATVSPTHAREITTEPGGFGLAADLNARADEDLLGILNGADYSIWSPENDAYIPVNYTVDSLNGKRQNKTALQHELGLPIRPTLPLLGFVARLTEQKGVDLLAAALDKMIGAFPNDREGFQVALIGQGESKYAQELDRLQQKYPNRIAFVGTYSEEFAHKILAASDILVVPSRFEPCGLSQIYGLKYGTIPVVHATGGLNDTVVDVENPLGTGFLIHDLNEKTLEQGLEKAVAHYRKNRSWRPMMARAMAMDFSWSQSALQYEELYYRELSRRGISVKNRYDETKSGDSCADAPTLPQDLPEGESQGAVEGVAEGQEPT